MGILQFNAQTVPPQVGMEALPQAWYKMVITKSAIKPNQKGDGGMLALSFTVQEGPLQGRVWVNNLNLFNPNAQAVEIAQKELSAICHVTGQYMLQSNDQSEDQAVPNLHNIPFYVHVMPQKGDARYNTAIGYKDINGNDPGKQGAAPHAPQTAPAAPGGWTPGAPAAAPGATSVPGGFTPPQQQQPAGPAAPAWGAPQAQPQQPQAQPGGWSPNGPAPAAAPQQQGGWTPGGAAPQAQPGGPAPGWTPQQQPGGAPVAPWQK